MLPIGPLMEEHRVIERMIPHLRTAVEKGRREGTIEPRLVDLIVDFVPVYADRCHHGKEEGILFAALAKKPLTPAHRKIMDELVEEHRQGREAVRKLREAAEEMRRADGGALTAATMTATATTATTLAALLDGFEFLAEFYPAHIRKEDKSFFIPVMDYFTEPEKRAMLETGYEFDRRLFHELYREKVKAVIGVVEGPGPRG
jgi:hemerythrin-like domain-containing protein